MADDAQVLADAKKLPLGDQLASSNWKVRAQALATVQERVGRAFSCEDEVFAEAGELGTRGSWRSPTRRRRRCRHSRPALPPTAGALPCTQARCWPRRWATPMPT